MIFGGYTPYAWCGDAQYHKSVGSFLFGITGIGCPRKFDRIRPGQAREAIYDYSSDICGFGIGGMHLMKKCNRNKKSYTKMGITYNHEDHGAHCLNGGKQKFKVEEYEVWQKQS